MEKQEIKKFEVGKIYQCRSICDYDCIWSFRVIKRTAKTVTLEDDHNKIITCRIAPKESQTVETVFPFGRYSMC